MIPHRSILQRRRAAIAWTVGFVFAWSVLEEALGGLFSQRYDLLQVVWWRYATHLVVVVMLFGALRRERPWRTRRPVLQCARSMLMLIMPASFVFGLAGGVPVDAIWTGFWIAPLLILSFAHLWLGERARWLSWGAAAACLPLAMVGHGARPSTDPVAVVAVLTMAGSFALYVVATRGLRAEALGVNLFYTGLVPLLLLTPMMPGRWTPPTGSDAAVLSAIGAVGVFALAALDRAVEADSASAVAPFLGLQVAVNLGLAHLAGGTLTRGAMGASLVFACIGVFLYWKADRLLRHSGRGDRLRTAEA